jgi:hypothetical protein
MADGTTGDGIERIEPSFRHGTITAVGVMTAFSLGFLTAWGANPLPWGAKDLYALIPILIGVILEMIALGLLLDPNCLELRRYRTAIRIFLPGMALVAVGVALALVVDYVSLGEVGASAALGK